MRDDFGKPASRVLRVYTLFRVSLIPQSFTDNDDVLTLSVHRLNGAHITGRTIENLYEKNLETKNSAGAKARSRHENKKEKNKTRTNNDDDDEVHVSVG